MGGATARWVGLVGWGYSKVGGATAKWVGEATARWVGLGGWGYTIMFTSLQ